jgi:hypothetical protein
VWEGVGGASPTDRPAHVPADWARMRAQLIQA